MTPVDPPSLVAAREHLARARELCRTDPARAAWHLADARNFRCDWPDDRKANEIRRRMEWAAEEVEADPAFAVDCIDRADLLLAEIYQHQTGATT